MDYEVQSNSLVPAQRWRRIGKFQPEDAGNSEDITPASGLPAGDTRLSTLVPSSVSGSLCLGTFGK